MPYKDLLEHKKWRKRRYEKHKLEENEYCKNWRGRMRQEGRCIRCGKPLTEDERIECMPCLTFKHIDLSITGVLKYADID